MQITNLTLAYLLEELRPRLEGAFVNKVQEVDSKTLKIKIRNAQGSQTLIATPEAVYLSRYSIPARKNPRGFAKAVGKALGNRKILSIKQHGLDRIAVLEFSENRLIFEFVSPGNAILTDSGMKILACLHAQEWRDRTVKRGLAYRFPAARGENPAAISKERLSELLSGSSTDLIRALVSKLTIAPQIGEEACIAAGIPKNEAAKKVASDHKKVASLHAAISNFYTVPGQNKGKAVLYPEGLLLPAPLKALEGLQYSECPSFNECIDDALSPSLAMKEEEALKTKRASMLEREAFNMRQQEEAEARFAQRAEEGKKKAELIYSNFQALDELCKTASNLIGKGLQEKEIMYKLSSLASGPRFKGIVPVALDIKARRLIVEVD